MGHNLPSLPSNVSIAGGKTPVSLGCKRFGQRGSVLIWFFDWLKMVFGVGIDIGERRKG